MWTKNEQLLIFECVFQLYQPIENFLDIFNTCCGYLKCSFIIELHVEQKIIGITTKKRELSTQNHNFTVKMPIIHGMSRRDKRVLKKKLKRDPYFAFPRFEKKNTVFLKRDPYVCFSSF